MTNQKISTLVEKPSKISASYKNFLIACYGAIIGILILATATYQQRIDLKKEQAIYSKLKSEQYQNY